ncbi:MAG TPA: response regulator transcription factor [Candidatus Acidoferrales bacterium]|nr:response regulator transcription factor [Candidatus Acidoferrales bacterium]
MVERNPLAQEFLRNILRGKTRLEIFSLEAQSRKRFSENEGHCRYVFVIDGDNFQTRLPRYLELLGHDFPQAKRIVLDFELPDDEICSLLDRGVDGFVPYPRVRETLPRAVRAVADGHLWVPPRVLEHYVSYVQKLSHGKRNLHEELSPREREIQELLQNKLSNKEISSTLGISESTVKFHLLRIFQKLGIHDRHALWENRSELTA